MTTSSTQCSHTISAEGRVSLERDYIIPLRKGDSQNVVIHCPGRRSRTEVLVSTGFSNIHKSRLWSPLWDMTLLLQSWWSEWTGTLRCIWVEGSFGSISYRMKRSRSIPHLHRTRADFRFHSRITHRGIGSDLRCGNLSDWVKNFSPRYVIMHQTAFDAWSWFDVKRKPSTNRRRFIEDYVLDRH